VPTPAVAVEPPPLVGPPASLTLPAVPGGGELWAEEPESHAVAPATPNKTIQALSERGATKGEERMLAR